MIAVGNGWDKREKPRKIEAMTRQEAAEGALASVRLEGLDPSPIAALSDAWVREEISTSELIQLAKRVATGEQAADLLPVAQS